MKTFMRLLNYSLTVALLICLAVAFWLGVIARQDHNDDGYVPATCRIIGCKG